jgi:hypothetical protein
MQPAPTQSDRIPAAVMMATLEMELNAWISMNAHLRTIAMETLHAPITTDHTTACATLATQETERTAQILMSAPP